ncbi:MAG: M23 family metallopeptidase [bacterium]
MLKKMKSRRKGQSWLTWVILIAAGASAAIVTILVLEPLIQTRAATQPADRTTPRIRAVTPPPPPPPPFHGLVYPTPQDKLLSHDGTGVFQPTASGRAESGRYGSVRTGKFHEGIDIAATQRDRRSRPLDPVRAVAAGVVGHVSRAPGNSNYGIYVVLIHDDPIGEVYTLYAHLAEATAGLSAGQRVEAGQVLGRMGSTPASIIPVSRGHLHFEMGLIANSRFRQWFLGKRLKPDHGIYNGWNLLAIDPLGVFAAHRLDNNFSFREHIRSLPKAFEMAVATPAQLDFFRRYPSLWEGEAFSNGVMVICCTANGVPLSGRNATEKEGSALAGKKACVLSVDTEALGANGLHIITRDGKNGWKPGKNSGQWLEILTY